METKNNKVSLKRDLSLYLLIFYGLGNILGAGIYVLIGKISGISGIYTPFSFIIACIVVLFTALSYAELSSRFPYSAGEALYAKEAFNSKYLSILIGFMIALSGILSSATILHGFYGYISNFIEIPETFASISIIILLCTIAILGIGKSVKFATILTLIEIFGLVIIVYIGVDTIEFKDVAVEKFIPPFEVSIWHAISLGAFLAFYAFIGFEDMVMVAEEVKEPILLSFIGIFAVINGALIQIIMVSRLLYGMGINKWIPSIFTKVNEKTRTPIFSTVFASSVILIFALWLPIVTLASLTSFFIFIIFTLMNLALIKIKRENPNPEGILLIPVWIPIMGIIINITLLFIKIFSLF